MGSAILADWGTSRRRLYLCELDGTDYQVLASREGRGVKYETNFEETFASDVADWVSSNGAQTAVLCGMVGSNIGWREAPYRSCPSNGTNLLTDRPSFSAAGCKVHIVPGLQCENVLQQPDLMRGEETQLLGWHVMNGERLGTEIVCLPGTHTKWAEVDPDGTVQTFLTSMQGEMFELLCNRSILIADKASDDSINFDVFSEAVEFVRHSSGSELMHMLFSTRSRQICGQLSVEASISYLSGMLIGSDVHSFLQLRNGALERQEKLPLIGSTRLCTLYAKAAELCNLRTEMIDAKDASLTGLAVLARGS